MASTLMFRTVEICYTCVEITDGGLGSDAKFIEWIEQKPVIWMSEGSLDHESYNSSVSFSCGTLDSPTSVPLELANSIVSEFNSSALSNMGMARVTEMLLSDDTDLDEDKDSVVAQVDDDEQ
jgi:hypothetical protein